jgi:alkylated DNA nucleotide flippase Atl1
MPLSELDLEHSVLAACALAPMGADLSGVFAKISGNRFSWSRVVATAAAHQIRPQLAAQIQALDLNAAIAGQAAAELAADARANLGHGQFLAGALVKVLETLRSKDILAVPFKGPAFATFLGAGPGLREMADLDILIRPADVANAIQALGHLDYRAAAPSQMLASRWLTRVTPELGLQGQRDSILIELHWRLAPHWYPAPCTVDDVMAHLTERDFFGRHVLWPAPEELFLIHVSDGMKSRGSGVRWIADVVRILRQHDDLDWGRIVRIAGQSGGLNSVRVALAVANELAGEVARRFDIPTLALSLPPQAQALAKEARQADRLSEAVRSIRSNLQSDTWNTSAMAHFKWALRLADHRARVAVEIVRYLARPMVSDLAAMPEQGESDFSLRQRALRRRLGRLLQGGPDHT